jgi:transposase
MASRINLHARIRVVQLHKYNVAKASILRCLHREGFNLSYRGVLSICKRWDQNGTYVYHKPPGRPPQTPYFVRREIDRIMDNNSETTAPEMQAAIKQKYGLTLSLATVKRIRQKLGWSYGSSKYCQFIRQHNQSTRLLFATVALERHWLFRDVVFTDECTVMLDPHTRKCFHRRGCAKPLKPRVKHPVKVHVWGGISWYGATAVCIFDGTARMKSGLFCRIIETCYVPFMEKFYRLSGVRPVLQMDNDPKHTSAATKLWLKRSGVVVMKWPAELPDLNPIECVWHQLKVYLQKHKPSCKSELVAGIKKFWKEKMTVAQCRRYVEHVQTVLPLVVQSSGGPTGL